MNNPNTYTPIPETIKPKPIVYSTDNTFTPPPEAPGTEIVILELNPLEIAAKEVAATPLIADNDLGSGSRYSDYLYARHNFAIKHPYDPFPQFNAWDHKKIY